jgi:hypothetical protein
MRSGTCRMSKLSTKKNFSVPTDMGEFIPRAILEFI